MSEHLSRRMLERLSVDDLGPGERDAAEQHVADCEACRTALSSLRAARDGYLEGASAERFARVVGGRIDAEIARVRRRTWASASVGALAIAACLVLFLRPRDDVRYKGSGVNVFLRHAGVVHLYAESDRLEVGDQLQVVVSTSRTAHVAGWFVDVDGKVDAITPGGAITVPPGEHPLPASAVVEAPCRDLTLIIDRAVAARDDDDLRGLAANARAHRSLPPEVSARVLRCR